MERSKIVTWAVVLAAAAAIIWWVGFHGTESNLPAAQQTAGAESGSAVRPAEAATGQAAPTPAGQAEPNVAREADTPAGPNEPAPVNPAAGREPNQPAGSATPRAKSGSAEPNAPARPPKTGGPRPSGPPAAADPNDPLEAINLKDVEMKNIIEKIAQWTGKTVIPHDEAMKQKVTIYAPDKLPRSKALARIYSALRMKGFVAEQVDDTIFLKPIADAKLGIVPTVQADQPLAAFENKDQIVQKFFKLTNYPPSQMGEIIRPLVGEYGHVGADETTGMLLVIDTVANLLRIEHIIAQFDVPEAGRAVTEVFELQYADPAEIVQLLRMLLGEPPDGRGRGFSRSRFAPMSRPSGPPPGQPGGKDARGAATSVVISAGDIPIILIPEPKHKWIIASGSAEDLKKIHDWIAKLDVEEPIESDYETVAIVYADPEEVADRIEDALQEMPGIELTPSVLVRPLEQSRQIMIFGRPDLREMVKKLIAEVDMPPGQFLTEMFELKHADPDQIKQNLEGLYETQYGSMSMYSSRGYRSRTVQPSETVKVISFPTMQQVTVIASPENMVKIRKQIQEWDVPLNVDEVKPRIIELKNSDPVQMADLLRKLFSEDQDSSRSLWQIVFNDRGDQRQRIVGPLYGQLTFEEVPGTKKIIVISKIPQAYEVVEQLVYDLDREEMAEIPQVVQLKYADPEDLAERLNAMFNEPGTTAPIRRTARGLGDYSMDESSQNQSSSSSRNEGDSAGGNAGEYTPWWSRGVRRSLDEEPISNVIGRVRFVPDPHSKAILVLAPPEFHESIERMIRVLDVPGLQVMIKATVLEVNHSDLTSLGIQLATNPEAFGNLEENAITALTSLTSLATHGSAAFAKDAPVGATGTGAIVGGTTSIFALFDFLIKHVNAKILNQQTLWTEDNEEASFFKGNKVAFVGDTSVTGTGIQQSSFQFEKVGMTLAVRPSITPEKNVDMIVNIILSQLTGELVNGQPVRTEMETETNMIVGDGDTLMLGGILFQEKSRIRRKLPLFGDIPLLGPFFQHYDVSLANSEMIVFITPYVVGDVTALSQKAKDELDKSKQRLEELRGELDVTAEELKERVNKP